MNFVLKKTILVDIFLVLLSRGPETKRARSILYCVTWSSIAAYKSLLLLPRKHRNIPWTPKYLDI